MSKIIISKTGEVHGHGSDRWKWVSRLTSEERAIARQCRDYLIVTKDARTHGGNPPFRVVVFHKGYYNHRVPHRGMWNEIQETINSEAS